VNGLQQISAVLALQKQKTKTRAAAVFTFAQVSEAILKFEDTKKQLYMKLGNVAIMMKTLNIVGPKKM
jgi:hypothetical protein